jgi:hypothetical protein
MAAILVWFSDARTRSSYSKRAKRLGSSVRPEGNLFMATFRFYGDVSIQGRIARAIDFAHATGVHGGESQVAVGSGGDQVVVQVWQS